MVGPNLREVSGKRLLVAHVPVKPFFAKHFSKEYPMIVSSLTMLDARCTENHPDKASKFRTDPSYAGTSTVIIVIITEGSTWVKGQSS